jgi:hypothetical protein
MELMLIIFHVLVALGSMLNSTILFFSPSQFRLYASYIMIALTLASGTYLVIITHSRLLQACAMGLVYLAVVSAGTVAGHYKLAAQKAEI